MLTDSTTPALHPFTGVKSVIQVQSASMRQCDECRTMPANEGGDYLVESIHHYIAHGYRLLYVGPETVVDHPDSGAENYIQTIAILGK